MNKTYKTYHNSSNLIPTHKYDQNTTEMGMQIIKENVNEVNTETK